MTTDVAGAAGSIDEILGENAPSLLGHTCEGIGRDLLHLPGPDFIDRIYADSDLSPRVLASLQRLFGHGALGEGLGPRTRFPGIALCNPGLGSLIPNPHDQNAGTRRVGRWSRR